jgi:hypothetical protein
MSGCVGPWVTELVGVIGVLIVRVGAIVLALEVKMGFLPPIPMQTALVSPAARSL